MLHFCASLRGRVSPTVARDLRTFAEYLERQGTGTIIVED
jgi:hypothetical protein